MQVNMHVDSPLDLVNQMVARERIVNSAIKHQSIARIALCVLGSLIVAASLVGGVVGAILCSPYLAFLCLAGVVLAVVFLAAIANLKRTPVTITPEHQVLPVKIELTEEAKQMFSEIKECLADLKESIEKKKVDTQSSTVSVGSGPRHPDGSQPAGRTSAPGEPWQAPKTTPQPFPTMFSGAK